MSAHITKDEVLEFMRSVSVMSAAMNGSEWPVATILLFVIRDDFTIYFATREHTLKANALNADNHISVSVWEYKKMLVQAHGLATRVTDLKEIDTTLDQLSRAAHNLADFWPPVLRLSENDYAIYKIRLSWIRALDLNPEVPIHATSSPFIEIALNV